MQILMEIFPGNVIKQLAHAFSCAPSRYGAVGEVWRVPKKPE